MTSEESAASAPSMRVRRSTFQFEIDYYKSKDLPIEECISSPTFSAGGYDWCLEYYPQGNRPDNKGSHVSLFLVLQSEARDITAEFSFQILDKRSNSFITTYKDWEHTFTSYDDYQGYPKFYARDKIEDLYCVKDIIVISCSIRVLSEPKVVKNYPGGLCEHIGKFWKKGERYDVTFEVEGESFSAHRFMLAARSPVFEANLFGPMAEAKIERIKIDEMKAEVFKALLHFIYTDQLPIDESNDTETDEETLPIELLQGLFVAADRYSLEKLIILCEEQLEKNFSVDMVATTLILAERHSRTSLKRKCLDYASVPENFLLVALTEGYKHIMTGAPALFAELSEKVKGSSAKRRRTS